MVAKQDRCDPELDSDDWLFIDRLRSRWTDTVGSVTAWKHVSCCW